MTSEGLQAEELEIVRIPVLQDNYVWLLHCRATGMTAVVDPAEADPVLSVCARHGWSLSLILVTHHHHDHIGGIPALRQATGCKVVANPADSGRIPGIDLAVTDGDSVSVGQARAQVMAVPGHTSGHIAFYFAGARALFCGDTLFLLGCGRMFEGTPQQFWSSLVRLRALPDETRVYCAHEYTAMNRRFAVAVDPENMALKERESVLEACMTYGCPTVPGVLGQEKATNPFLRADVPALARAVGLEAGADPVAVFAALRQRKDTF